MLKFARMSQTNVGEVLTYERCDKDGMLYHCHLEYNRSVVRFTVLLEEQLQSLSGHRRLPPTKHKHQDITLSFLSHAYSYIYTCPVDHAHLI